MNSDISEALNIVCKKQYNLHYMDMLLSRRVLFGRNTTIDMIVYGIC